MTWTVPLGSPVVPEVKRIKAGLMRKYSGGRLSAPRATSSPYGM